MAKNHNISFNNKRNIAVIDKSLWYKRNEALQDIPLLENNPLCVELCHITLSWIISQEFYSLLIFQKLS